MNPTDFISQEFIKENFPINQNIEPSIIGPIIPMASDLYILPILGTALYNRLISSVQTTSLSGDYLTLMTTYVQPALLNYVMYEALPFLNYRITNINVGKHKTDTSDPVNEDELLNLRKQIYYNANYFAERCTRFLRANPDLYPEYYAPGTKWDTIIPVPTSYFSGIHIQDTLYDVPNYATLITYLRRFGY